MNKLGKVAWQEYRRRVFTKRFVLIGILSVPLVTLALVGIVFLVFYLETNTTPLGYVDHSGLLNNPVSAPAAEAPFKSVAMLAYDTEAEARAALEAGQIQGYYVLPADYLARGELSLYHLEAVKSPARDQFNQFLRANLLRNMDPVIANRLIEGADIVVQSPDGSRSMSAKNWWNIFIPMLAGIAFIIALFTTGGYLMQAVAEEKENRTMEVVITSVSPNQFMAGKILGDMGVGITQIGIWALFIITGILVLRKYFAILQSIQIGTQTWLVMIFILLPVFVTVSALMAAIGATVTDAREGQQVTGIINLPIWLPYMLTGLLMNNPSSPLVIALSLFPMTAPLTMLLRNSLTILPGWQIALSAVVQILCAVGAIWLAGRAFRMGMLRYGKRLRWAELFKRTPQHE